MNKEFWDALPLVIGALGLFSWLAVASWADERRREREAFYKSEAIKKLAEMPGGPSDAMLQLLRDTLTPSVAPSSWWMTRGIAAAHYRSEALREIARGPGKEAALDFLREQERNAGLRVRAGLRLGGSVAAAVGIGLMPILWMMVPDMPVYMAGLIPILVGIALLTCSYTLFPKS